MRKNDRRSNTSQYLPQSAIYAAKRGLSMKANVKTFLSTGTAAIVIGLSAGSAQAVTFSFNSGNIVGNFTGVPASAAAMAAATAAPTISPSMQPTRSSRLESTTAMGR
jgi:hypothetical protein